MERIKIYMNTPSWNVGTNTDIRLQREMVCLEKDLENVSLYFPKSWILSLPYNIDKVCGFIKRKVLGTVTLDTKDGWVLRRKALYNEPEIWFASCDVIYAQGILPTNLHGKPILLDLFYMRPEDVNPTFSEKAQVNFDILSKHIKELARTKGIFNLRSDYAIRMVEELCPDNAWKFRNLPFLRPNIKAASTDEIIEKHTNDDTTRFLFCGAQANRKGLPVVIESFIKAKEAHECKSELHIVSALSDGNVGIPQRDDIIFHGGLPFDETQELFRKCHAYIMPSREESFGLTYTEAMANGLVTIARNYEPQREILDYGKCGILTNIDTQSVTRSIENVLLLTREERIDFALKARDRFIKKYSYGAALKEWQKAIEDCFAQQ
ncbi:MAG: glycosyltransferase family 4 protein [Bacteroidaceae bacterium]|nr:glycosyltransferase family 4 protein [Bacteroidaceae bacterium]